MCGRYDTAGLARTNLEARDRRGLNEVDDARGYGARRVANMGFPHTPDYQPHRTERYDFYMVRLTLTIPKSPLADQRGPDPKERTAGRKDKGVRTAQDSKTFKVYDLKGCRLPLGGDEWGREKCRPGR